MSDPFGRIWIELNLSFIRKVKTCKNVDITNDFYNTLHPICTIVVLIFIKIIISSLWRRTGPFFSTHYWIFFLTHLIIENLTCFQIVTWQNWSEKLRWAFISVELKCMYNELLVITETIKYRYTCKLSHLSQKYHRLIWHVLHA